MTVRQATAGNVGDVLFNASRQVWLAGLGAAVVTRDWAEKEAGSMFRNLVREGTAIESRAMRVVGDRLESSFLQANAAWKRARSGVTHAVKAYADTAATLVRESLPASLPKPVAAPKRKPRKAVTAKAKTPARRTRRATRTTKR